MPHEMGSHLMRACSMNQRTPSTRPSLPATGGERVPEGRERGRFMVPMHAKKRKGTSMNREVVGAGCLQHRSGQGTIIVIAITIIVLFPRIARSFGIPL